MMSHYDEHVIFKEKYPSYLNLPLCFLPLSPVPSHTHVLLPLEEHCALSTIFQAPKAYNTTLVCRFMAVHEHS